MLKIASYNVRCLFTNLGRDGGRTPKEESEVRALLRSVDALRADVLAAQEVESEAALRRLNARLRTPYPHTALVEGNSTRSLHLAVLSRHPFSVTSHRDLVLCDEAGRPMEEFRDEGAATAGRPSPLRFQRDCLVARFDLAGGARLVVANLHLKSSGHYRWLRHEPAAIRAAEARAAARIVGACEDDRVVVAGDLNDVTGQACLRPLTVGLGFDDPLGSGIEARGQDAHTFHGAGHRTRLDYILLSPAAAERYRAGSVRVHRSRVARRASDHYPISLELRL